MMDNQKLAPAAPLDTVLEPQNEPAAAADTARRTASGDSSEERNVQNVRSGAFAAERVR